MLAACATPRPQRPAARPGIVIFRCSSIALYRLAGASRFTEGSNARSKRFSRRRSSLTSSSSEGADEAPREVELRPEIYGTV